MTKVWSKQEIFASRAEWQASAALQAQFNSPQQYLNHLMTYGAAEKKDEPKPQLPASSGSSIVIPPITGRPTASLAAKSAKTEGERQAELDRMSAALGPSNKDAQAIIAGARNNGSSAAETALALINEGHGVPESEAMWRAVYQSNTALQSEFASEEVFVAYRRDRARARP